MKVGMISLGCPKNQVDAEVMLGSLAGEMTVTADVTQADVVIVNTCGFIESAKQEAIDNILEMCRLKEAGIIRKVIVTGCLAQRYEQEILRDIPEVDAVVGLARDKDIVEIVRSVAEETTPQKDFGKAFDCLTISGPRMVSTPPHYAYLKIAEGCDNRCTYCAIPMIRGRFVSRPMEELVAEAEDLAAGGVKELIVVAQDTTRYGMDLYGEMRLAQLLRRLDEIPGLEWIRILYCYPEGMTDELIEVLAEDNKILPYVDLPLQHISDSVLKRMHRPVNGAEIRALIRKLRDRIPNLELRTTLLTGFPGETEEDFEQLTEFIQETGFQKLGCFAYSQEEGTPAARMKDQLPEEVKEHRAELVMTCQATVLEQMRADRVGTVTQVIVESESEDGIYAAREWRDAPEIDFTVWLETKQKLHPGQILDAVLTEISDCEYTAVLKEERGI